MGGVGEAIDGCVGFLLGAQEADGSWCDWDLPPGPSDAWTTAYVGRRLAAAIAGRPIEAAAEALAARQLGDFGWGYNARVGSDADSTANAILLLTQAGAAVSARSRARLLAFQQPSGGFATYSPDEGLGSWGREHAEVTAAAAQALRELDARPTPELEQAIGYLRRRRAPDGLWQSFWWRSPVYATAAVLALPDVEPTAATRAALLSVLPQSAFERGLLVDCLPGELAGPLVAALIDTQRPDGSWASEPILRLTDRDCDEPWARDDAGPLYGDPCRLFTSATILGALARHAGGEGGVPDSPPAEAGRLRRVSTTR